MVYSLLGFLNRYTILPFIYGCTYYLFSYRCYVSIQCVRTFPRTSIDTPSRSSVFNFSSIHIRTCRDAGVCVIPCIFFSYSSLIPYYSIIYLCNSVLLHYAEVDNEFQ